MKRNYKEITNINIEQLFVISQEPYSDELQTEADRIKEKLIEELAERMTRLTEFEMTVIKMKYYSGPKQLSNLEVSRRLKINVAKIWRTVRRAFKKLKS